MHLVSWGNSKIRIIYIQYIIPELHIITLILHAMILKIVSFHDLSLGAPLAGCTVNVGQAALRDKFWKEIIFKIMAGRINASIYNMLLLDLGIVL